MKKFKLFVMIMALVLSISLVATACGTNATTTTGTTAGTTAGTTGGTTAGTTGGTTGTTGTTGPKLADKQEIAYNMSQEPPQLNTALTTDTVSFDIIRHTYEGLTKRDNKDAIVPGIAESWTVSTDGLVYTFKLRDAKWSNGDAVTAADFAFGFKVLLSADTKPQPAEYAYFAFPIKNAEKFNGGEAKFEEVGIKVVDPKTLEITLERPTGYFLDLLAFGVMMPINEKFYNEVGAEQYGMEADKMIYNGAFVVDSWEHDVELVMAKNPNYYGADNIKLTKITGTIIKDSQAAFTQFLNGDLDLANLTDSNYVTQATEKGYKINSYSDGATFYLEFNLQRKELQNVKIRKAITMALNRVDFTEKILKNNSLPALSLTSPAIRGTVPGTSFQKELGALIKDNNSEEAKKLYAEGLQELGISSISLGIIGDDTDNAVRYSNAISTYLKQNLGIDLKVESMPFKSRLQRMTDKDFDVVFAGWGPDYNDPMTFLDLWETGNGNNHTSYSSAAYDALLKKARESTDEKERFQAYVDMEKLLMEDLPIAPVYFRMRDYTTKESLVGVYRSPFQDVRFLDAYVAG